MRHGMARGVVDSLMSIAARIAVPFVVRSVPVLGNHATGEALALTMAFRLGRQISDTADHLLGGVIQDQLARGASPTPWAALQAWRRILSAGKPVR